MCNKTSNKYWRDTWEKLKVKCLYKQDIAIPTKICLILYTVHVTSQSFDEMNYSGDEYLFLPCLVKIPSA